MYLINMFYIEHFEHNVNCIFYLRYIILAVFRSSECCFSFSKVSIPVKHIESYHITHPECPMRGIM